MPPFIKATPAELAEIKASVKVAMEQLKRINWNTHKPKRGKNYIPDKTSPPGKSECKKYLQQEAVQSMVLTALKKGNGHFFVMFGQHLRRFAYIDEEIIPCIPLASFFMVDHWATAKDGLPEFCYLKPADITQLCIERLYDESITEEALVKTRQRLKLKPYRRKLDAKVGSDGKLTFPQLDK